ncbi:carbon-nitrogen hydrolase family protein [Paenibacillus psychroresistens]|uniref:Carbon-nitrogen hydrolase family protein n=1 Tax=Paenibacillus psychroresistens TaxID=1778678 RepID=A0A6B8RRN3_9BACL|nr:carbon-nitrogen hydrolase family protein [Paenibacillus psychroresistens]QGQ98143.1 carbon-nitrogen hydrolase family protein [Paenibacillus psychroresistens]
MNVTYHMSVDYLPERVKSETVSISVIYTWIDTQGNWLNRGYVDELKEIAHDWRKLGLQMDAPEAAVKLKIELEFRWSENGLVQWRNPRLVITNRAVSRKVKLATTYYMPERGTADALAHNLCEILLRIDAAGQAGADLICISEAQCSRCTDFNDLFRDTPEVIPGHLSAAISSKAKEYGTYIVFNLDERDGVCVYNTSLLFDRQGQIAGKYRKVHLPMAEAQLGFTPGNDYPVFDTDFGRVGMLICWDQVFSEPARIMRLQGAEILCISTAGEAPIQTAARAVDNGVYVVVAGTNGEQPSRIINPLGEILCEFGRENTLGMSCVEIDLNEKFNRYWESVGPAYGEMRSLYIKERRPDTYKTFKYELKGDSHAY